MLVSDRQYAFIKKFQPLAVTCQAHFHLSHSSLDKLSASNIVPVVTVKKLSSQRHRFLSMFVSIADGSNYCMLSLFLINCCMTESNFCINIYVMHLCCQHQLDKELILKSKINATIIIR